MPELGPGDVLIRVERASICGTDVHIYEYDAWAQATLKLPLVVGHEFAGRVVDTGSAVRRFKKGDRVSGEGHLTCGSCRNCLRGIRHLCPNTLGLGVNRNGCFAEYVALPEENACLLPDEVSNSIASICDPLGNAVHTVLSFDTVGEDVLILGAGPIGMMAAAICRHIGARHVVVSDPNPYRLALAQQMGATCVVDPLKTPLEKVVASLGIPHGFDIVLEMSGNMQALQSSLAVCAPGAKIGLLGILPKQGELDWHQVIFKGLFLKGIYGREIFSTWQKMLRMLQSGLDVSKVITHEYSFLDFEKGFEVMSQGKSGKVVLHWTDV